MDGISFRHSVSSPDDGILLKYGISGSGSGISIMRTFQRGFT
jgi:hypothetical protein